MNLELKLALLCEEMILLLNELKEKGLITEEEFIDHIKLKREYLEKNLVGMKCQ